MQLYRGGESRKVPQEIKKKNAPGSERGKEYSISVLFLRAQEQSRTFRKDIHSAKPLLGIYYSPGMHVKEKPRAQRDGKTARSNHEVGEQKEAQVKESPWEPLGQQQQRSPCGRSRSPHLSTEAPSHLSQSSEDWATEAAHPSNQLLPAPSRPLSHCC